MNRLFMFALCFTLFGCKPELTVEIGMAGVVASDDGTINCPSTCVRKITGKQVITLTASEFTLFYPFHHWEGACTGTDPVCELELDPSLPITVKAQFAHKGKKLGDIEFEDPNLQACIRDMVPEYRYQPARLYSLNCSDRGIESLVGIEELDTFHGYYNFDDNKINDLEPLIGHSFAYGLSLRNNAIVDPTPLSQVEVSGQLLLEGIPDIDCDAMQYLMDNYWSPLVPDVPQCGIYSQNEELEGSDEESSP